MIYCPVKPQNSGYEGQFVNSENWLKSQDIPYVKADETDWSRDKPHVVVMQTPYDEYHRLPCFRSDVFGSREFVSSIFLMGWNLPKMP